MPSCDPLCRGCSSLSRDVQFLRALETLQEIAESGFYDDQTDIDIYAQYKLLEQLTRLYVPLNYSPIEFITGTSADNIDVVANDYKIKYTNADI
ncbi:unnamed protein product, partial [Didymodactylos carnosus]